MQPRTDRPKYLRVDQNRHIRITRSFARYTLNQKATRNPDQGLNGECITGALVTSRKASVSSSTLALVLPPAAQAVKSSNQNLRS